MLKWISDSYNVDPIFKCDYVQSERLKNIKYLNNNK